MSFYRFILFYIAIKEDSTSHYKIIIYKNENNVFFFYYYHISFSYALIENVKNIC